MAAMRGPRTVRVIVLCFALALGLAAGACGGGEFDDYRKRTRKSEAQIQLNKLGKAAIVEYNVNARFPTETAPLTPAADCCAENFEGKRKCGPTPANWSTPAWRALDFELSAPHFFRYSYTPSADGTSFTATAVGDLDCDGVAITYTLNGSVESGTPKLKLTDPPPNSD